MRVLAASIHPEDYRVYDVDCEYPLQDLTPESEVKLRNKTDELNLSVIPNPNKGEFLLKISDPDKVNRVEIVDMHGNVYLNLSEINEQNQIQVEQIGVFMILAYKNDGTITTTKYIALD